MPSILSTILRLLSIFYSYCRLNRPPPSTQPTAPFPQRQPCRHELATVSGLKTRHESDRSWHWSLPYTSRPYQLPPPSYSECEGCPTGLCSCGIGGHINSLQLSTRRLSAPAALPAPVSVVPVNSTPHTPLLEEETHEEEERDWVERWLKDTRPSSPVESDSDSDTDYSISSLTSNTRVDSEDEDVEFFSSPRILTKFNTPSPSKQLIDLDTDVFMEDGDEPPRMHKSKQLRGVATSLHWRRHDRSVSPSPTPRRSSCIL